MSNVCEANSCVYGTCVTLSNTSYQCQCTDGFMGAHCDLGMLKEIIRMNERNKNKDLIFS